MAVDEDDLLCLRLGLDLAGVAHADQVFGELGLAFDATGALRDHEGLETLLAQAAQDVDGGDVGVPIGPAGVLAQREDGRRDSAHLVLVHRLICTKNAGGTAREAGGQRGMGGVHGESPGRGTCRAPDWMP